MNEHIGVYMQLRLHTQYRKIIEYLLPSSTRRREFYRILVRAIHVLLADGPASLWRNIFNYLASKRQSDSKIRNESTITSRKTLNQKDTHIQHSANELILVYQMGRVGSKSIEASLGQYYSSKQIVHGHFLNSFEELEKRAQTDLADTTNFMADLKMVDKRIRKAIQTVPKTQKIKIVSLVRDPISRNVSTFFFALDEFIPNWEIKFSNHMLTVDDLHSIFVSRRSFVLSALNWFDEQMKPAFGIDVYSTPFPREKGFNIYSTLNVDLLLFRLENLNQCAQEAFEEFLGIKDFNLLKINTSEEKETRNLYHLFKTKPLPYEYVQWTYSSKLARHFYTETELDTFVRKWTSVVEQ